MTCSEVQCNLKCILWSNLYAGLVSVITSAEVFCSILLTPHYPAVLGRAGMAAPCTVCLGGILTPQPSPWSSWCHPLVPLPFCIWQLSLYQQVQFQWGSVFCSLSWQDGPWGCSQSCVLQDGPWGCSGRLGGSCGDVSGTAGRSTQELLWH